MPTSAMTPIVPPIEHERMWPPQSGQPDSSYYGPLLEAPLAQEGLIVKQMAIYGAIGILGASVLTAGITAATFAAYRKSDSIAMPALISGLGSMAMGGILLWLLIRSSTQETDSRFVYTAAGAQLAF